MNYYGVATAEELISCSLKDYKELTTLNDKSQSENGDGFCHGFSFEFNKGKNQLFIYAEENNDIEEMGKSILDKLCSIIKKAKKEYLQFGVAYYADRTTIGSAGGNAFRIYSDGSIIYANLVWPE